MVSFSIIICSLKCMNSDLVAGSCGLKSVSWGYLGPFRCLLFHSIPVKARAPIILWPPVQLCWLHSFDSNVEREKHCDVRKSVHCPEKISKELNANLRSDV